MQKYKIVKEYYKSGEVQVMKHRFVIEEYQKVGLFKKKWEWVPITESMATVFGTFSYTKTFETEQEARDYVQNKMNKLPKPEVIEVFTMIEGNGTV